MGLGGVLPSILEGLVRGLVVPFGGEESGRQSERLSVWGGGTIGTGKRMGLGTCFLLLRELIGQAERTSGWAWVASCFYIVKENPCKGVCSLE